MRKLCLHAAALAVSLGGASWSHAQPPAAPPAATALASPAPLSAAAHDQDFVQEMTQASRFQTEASLLAMIKADDPTVRSFAREMVATYEHRLTRLMRMAQDRGIQLAPRPSALHENRVELMRQMSPEQFQREYARAYGVQNLQRLRTLAEREIEHGQDPELLPQLDASIRSGQALSALQVFPDAPQVR